VYQIQSHSYILVTILKHLLFDRKPCRKIFQWEYLKSFQTICAVARYTEIYIRSSAQMITNGRFPHRD